MREVRPALVNTSPYPSDAWCHIPSPAHYSRFSGAPKSFCMDMHGNSRRRGYERHFQGKEQTVVSLMSDRYHGVQIRNLLRVFCPLDRRFLSGHILEPMAWGFQLVQLLGSYWAVTGYPYSYVPVYGLQSRLEFALLCHEEGHCIFSLLYLTYVLGIM